MLTGGRNISLQSPTLSENHFNLLFYYEGVVAQLSTRLKPTSTASGWLADWLQIHKSNAIWVLGDIFPDTYYLWDAWPRVQVGMKKENWVCVVLHVLLV